jgi:hypothetical protein
LAGINRSGKPPFRFTNRRIGRITKKEYLVVTHWGTSGVNVWKQYGDVHKAPSVCTPCETYRESTGALYSTYDEQTRNFSGYNTYVKSGVNPGEVHSSLLALRNELIAEASMSYDLLTELAEAREFPRMVKSIAGDLTKILGSLKSRFGRNVLRKAKSIRPLDLLKHPEKVFRKFGDYWMTYRYGIMPLAYSVRDVMKTMNRGIAVRTRKHKSIKPQETGQSYPGPSVTYKVEEVTGSVELYGEIFQYFTSSEIARLTGVSMNPLVTAWELIPYSFVFDWFIGIGDYITALSDQGWAQIKYAQLSKRDKTSKKTWVHLPNRDKTVTVSNKLPTNWVGSAPPSTPSVIIPNPEGLYILEEEVVDTYWREVISFSPVAPVINPNLNWKRLVDSAVLSLNLLGDLLRRL